MSLIGNCPHCSREIRVARSNKKNSRCPYCDGIFSIAENLRVESGSKENRTVGAPITRIDPTNSPRGVVVVGIDMPFQKIAAFMIKWTIASIPALFIWIILFLASLKLLKIYGSFLL